MIKGFDSFEEMQEYMEESMAAADARVTPRQAEVGPGDHWFSPAPEFGCVVFGQVYTREELVAGMDPEEAADEEFVDGYLSGNMLFGRAFSVIEPQGELGSTHRSAVWPMTPAQFAEAMSVDWDHQRLGRWFREALVQAVRECAP